MDRKVLVTVTHTRKQSPCSLAATKRRRYRTHWSATSETIATIIPTSIFCKHPSCIDHFQCDNGQCVTYDKTLRLVVGLSGQLRWRKICVDYKLIKVQFESVPPPPALITFDGSGNFISGKNWPSSTSRALTTTTAVPGELNYCLPVYTRL